MIALGIFALAAAAALSLGLAVSPAGDDALKRRIAGALGVSPPPPEDKSRRRRIAKSVRRSLGGTRAERLRIALLQGGLALSPRAFVRNAALFGLGVAVTALLFGFGPIVSPLIGLLGGVGGAWAVLRHRQRTYRTAFVAELPNAIDAIVRGLRAGLPLPESMRLVAREAADPLKGEMQRVLDQVALGQTMPDAVLTLHDRVPTADVKFFAIVIAVQNQAGGNLSEALGNLSRVLRNRKRMLARISALSSEARASAMIIGGLPFAIAFMVSITTPGYMAPLFTTDLGHLCLLVAAVLLIVGTLVMRRMIRFEL